MSKKKTIENPATHCKIAKANCVSVAATADQRASDRRLLWLPVFALVFGIFKRDV
jgi:hypothetical protein